MLKFNKRYRELLETNSAGGAGSVFGSTVTDTSTHFSGDYYAPNDARKMPHMMPNKPTKKDKKKKKPTVITRGTPETIFLNGES